ncbi:MAG: DUF484 family protein [Burkholderiales bacterium]|nr:DUF484 family protein [Burkholderiales bacterium]
MNPTTGVQGITENDIADYLANTPGFFERHAELLSSVQLTSPHGQRAVSLQERQMEMLRERIKGLERRIVEMLRHGQENLALADRLHRWTLRLLTTQEAAELPGVMVQELRHEFMIPQAAIRVWDVQPGCADAAFAQRVSDDARSFTSSLAQPYCGVNAGFEAVSWLDEPGSIASLALIPLREAGEDSAFGLLVLGSPDPTRYQADMGTEFLMRIGEIASAALSRLRPHRP